MPARWPGMSGITLTASRPPPPCTSRHQTPSSGCWNWRSCLKFKIASRNRPAVATASRVACKRLKRLDSMGGLSTSVEFVARRLPCDRHYETRHSTSMNRLRTREIVTSRAEKRQQAHYQGLWKMQETVGRLH